MKLEKLDFIDSLSERHHQLRKTIEQLWNHSSDIPLSHSEWYIIAKIYNKKTTIADVAKKLDITRQATHKLIKNLEAKGIVEISNLENNKKVKAVCLTNLGETCYEKNQSIKSDLENKISKQIGLDNFRLLQNILVTDWGLNE